ncbi:acyl-CoA dehydrogenase [Mycolicibacterium phlei]|jgi:alkylation response protein AidB-like acyl-CoA dehydrogenase|uniref:Acyl-CoA dehydrogenase n=1 Tax=Mycolicibacterium phlei DSM 43239 = CCUG 21000 TaxID=1226750 RepID=A0A5N5UPK3_MYCPH|nr:acyl-CoA dehydrogenase [Mycolicibacterium phlei]VEG08744.1 acyl-CoA dehydrogenase [Mycobacteroides chelonae]AMO60626.1 Glutaryl-CoA dehydrogenase [Mycolicibacterium phlei]KAB7751493.1 acyl-CoA dehydrogenase [Mycolicibacterium phlei DSM 43239 = CCUG 21000]KXW68134.1 acyl-CoA dehydrogenase [Mycolicibacterium phlei DSM 43239 = CCUG 21000]KXW68377.1 acyl-CoA dehydrogenase [Mycolicibacterium phlei DSM 43070]
MTLALTAEQRELTDAVAAFAARRAPLSATREGFADIAKGRLPSWWDEFAATGFPVVHLPESCGGQGGTMADAACVLEAAGRAGLPGPLLPTMTAGAVALLADEASALLHRLAGGAPAAVVLPPAGEFSTRRDGDRWLITGTSDLVSGIGSAAVILLGTPQVWAVVDPAHPAVTLDPVDGTDLLTDVGRLRLADYPVEPADMLTGIDPERAEYLAVALTAGMATGIAGWCVQAATEHLRTREQFGTVIGTFQALQHSAAMLLVNTELAAAATWDAVRAAGEPIEQHRIAAAGAALTAVASCPDLVLDTLTLFGAIGFTWEHDVHLHWRRATSLAASIGARTRWARLLGRTTATCQRDFAVDLGDAQAEFRAWVAETLDAALTLRNDGPGREGDQEHFATGPQRTLLAEARLIAPHWAPPWGLGADPLQQLIINEEFARRPELVRPSLGISEWILPSVIRAGSPELQQRLIPPTQRGELGWCQLFSEPGAGSDLAALTTRAVKVDDGWRITGHKIWTSCAHRADYGALLARTDPDAPKHRGIGYFIVDMSADGIEVQPIRQASGDADFNEVFLTDVFVPDEMLLGGPTDGWSLAIATMAEERSAISGYVQNDRAAPLRPAARRDEDAQRELGELDAYANAIKALGVRETIRLLDGQPSGPASSIAKVAMNVLLRRTFAATVGAAGSAAMAGDTDVVQSYLRVPAELIGGGTKEIQLNIIAQMILGLPRR